ARMPVMHPPVTLVVPRHSTAFQDQVNTPQTPRNRPTRVRLTSKLQVPCRLSLTMCHAVLASGVAC
ncbi:hypothetical protein M422DRAFT_38272, partial [Sphaerobolus stellatus SS14]